MTAGVRTDFLLSITSDDVFVLLCHLLVVVAVRCMQRGRKPPKCGAEKSAGRGAAWSFASTNPAGVLMHACSVWLCACMYVCVR